MKIIINEKGSKDFYKEILNVSAQYRKLLRHPETKLIDQFKAWKCYFIIGLILLVFYVVEIFIVGISTFIWLFVGLLVFIVIFSLIMLIEYNKRLTAYLNDDENAILNIDDEGVELCKKTLSVKLSWDNIAFARSFKEATCFIPKKQTGLIIAVSNAYLNEIEAYIKVEVYKTK